MVKKRTTTLQTISTKDYMQVLSEIKQRVKEAQIKAAFAVNRELIKLYWLIGKTIVEKQKECEWGSGVIDQLAKDLQNEFPGIGGFSRANLFRIKNFYVSYAIVAQAVRQFDDLEIFNIPWGHNIILLEKLKDNDKRLWYAQKAIEHGWSRSMLEMWIESDLIGRKGKAITNFKNTLPIPQSDMAQQSLKDPYLLDFLDLSTDFAEKEVEQGLMDNIQQFLLELGKGFAFVGRQHHLEVDGDDFYIDLLFYNYKLHCFVVFEIKARKFDPRDTGQLTFYVAAVDNQIKHASDGPTIGILLCKSKNNLSVEYALESINKPIGVSEFKIKTRKTLPKELKSSLPTVEEFEFELEKRLEINKPKTVKPKKRK